MKPGNDLTCPVCLMQRQQYYSMEVIIRPAQGKQPATIIVTCLMCETAWTYEFRARLGKLSMLRKFNGFMVPINTQSWSLPEGKEKGR